MSTSTVQSVNLLPTYLQTNKNSKFLSSTIDQLIQPAQLERLNAYIGSTSTPTYQSGDIYIQESSPLRQAYQLEPALITKDINGVVQDVVAIDDLANEILVEGGIIDNFDRLFRSQVYPYYPQIDWNKLTNYQKYYWLPEGPVLIDIDQPNLDVLNRVIGVPTPVVSVSGTNITLLNGMLISFSGDGVSEEYKYKEYFVEGTGTSVVLIPFNELTTPESSAQYSPEFFDTDNFDTFGYDNDRNMPIDPQYITINRASQDRNAWSRANRWVSEDVIIASCEINKEDIKLPSLQRAERPIIEFNANLQLFNHGSTAGQAVDLIDNVTTNAFLKISGTPVVGLSNTSSYVVDGIYLEHGQRIIFTKDADPTVQNNIYEVQFVNINGTYTVTLAPTTDTLPALNESILVLRGEKFGGTTVWYNGSLWVKAQQKTNTNQAPLFDLFDEAGISYSNRNYYLSNFSGNEIFGYSINESNPVDPVLGLTVDYRNISSIGSYLFTNYFGSGKIVISESSNQTTNVPTSNTYFKLGNQYLNVWSKLVSPSIRVNSSGYYDIPLSLANNPLNSNLTNFTLSDLDEQAATNTRLIANGNNPMSFPMMFIGKKTNSVIDAIDKSADAYNRFKIALIAQASAISDVSDPAVALDTIITNFNLSRTSTSPYYLSDMLAYGIDKTTLVYTVTNTSTVSYPTSSEFNLNVVSNRSVLVYLNNEQLAVYRDYIFDQYDAGISIVTPLTVGDVITIRDYGNTHGNFIPPTPTKLGLYPSFVPQIISDNTYANGPVNVIQGHDGSLTVAFGDYRDAIILEYERRVYNNLKIAYKQNLFDVNSSNPGAFRDSVGTSTYSLTEINDILQQDFIKWSGTYGINYTTNSTVDLQNELTWNYKNSVYLGLRYPGASTSTGITVSGSWRAIFKYFYDTDRPHTNPWEMLGFTSKPSWWESEYGPAPYTSGNGNMWSDIEQGIIAQGTRVGRYPLYARTGLSKILPVDNYGNLLTPGQIGLISNKPDTASIQDNWVFGDQGPAETAWRRSSYWPFALQRLLALTQPASYCSLMYDPYNMNVNVAGQWTYGSNYTFLQLENMPIHGENGVATSGYSVFVSEIGQQRTQNYIKELRQDLEYASFNLFHKVGGFVSKSTLQVIIDAYEPTTNLPGAVLPNENYTLILNTSNPIKSIGISGIIIQRLNGNYVIRGYDQQNPYFTYYPSVRNSTTPTITIGGVSANYVVWTSASSIGATNLTSLDTTTARAASANIFYQAGQIVQYGNNFYRVLVSHAAEAVFDSSLYQILSALPTVGGATVQTASSFNKNAVQVPYGTTFNNIQDLYDLIVGYGAWLTDQGFVFDNFNKELGTNVDWYLSGREFLFWSTQNWTSNSVITLSPFADQLTYQSNNSVVNNVFDKFYDYNIARADGTPFPQSNLFITRQNGQFKINVINNPDGIYFARLLCIQKEHGMVFDNTDIFGDVIYDIETGERQERVKLVGFRTSNWNGDFFAPGFLYDEAKVVNWTPYKNYLASDVVLFNGQYYSAKSNIQGAQSFVFDQWNVLKSAPTAGLFPNFDFQINQFNDYYSLDIDNFDASIQQAAQNLTGYTPRPYLNNIFSNPVSQYKFYEGFIKEKGTANPILKLASASLENLNSQIEFTEEWAFRVGQYGSFTTYNEFEVPLQEGTFVENPQIVSFVDTVPENNSLISYITPNELTIGTGTLPKVATTTSTDVFELPHSGYVRFDDVDSTAYNRDSLLDIANNDIIEDGTTIWLGFTPDGNWDVLRYTFQSADIVSVVASQPYSQITFITSGTHNLSVGQLVSVVDVDVTVDGIYTIQAVPSKTEFTVASTLGSIDFPDPISPGLLFTFDSIRVATYDDMPTDQILYRYDLGTNIWVDSGNGTDNNGWAVYKKIVNYSNTATFSYLNVDNVGFGYSISKPKGSNVLAIGSPYFSNIDNNGVYVSGNVGLYQLENGSISPLSYYQLADTPGNGNLYGYSVAYNPNPYGSAGYGLIFGGAPGANHNSGEVIVTSIDQYGKAAIDLTITTSTYGWGFGSSVNIVPINYNKSVLFVGAPTGTGTVYTYLITTGTNSVSSTYSGSVDGTTAGSRFGTSVATDKIGKTVAIGAPGYNSSGTVYIYLTTSPSNNPTFVSHYNILSPFTNTTTNFGQSVALSQDGSYLAVGAPNVLNADGSLGAVAIYQNNGSEYVPISDFIITNPVAGSQMKFGVAMDFNTETNILVVSALGTNSNVITYFDGHSTTFDLNTTRFTETESMSGSVYMYSRRDTRFVYSEELINSQEEITTGTNYGTSVVVDEGIVIVGAPGGMTSTISSATSAVYQFTANDPTIVGWQQTRVQDDLVLVDKVQKICLVDTVANDIVNYYDYVDPIKGKIVGIAQAELTYQLPSDPAIYSIGGTGTNVNPSTPWMSVQVGQLWWDLSTAKFTWYEQGDLEYRRNNWGKLFPGASIDVYEWVESSLLPSDWAIQADTTSGLTSGISGQPKFVDNGTLSVNQVYDTATNSLVNKYYFWVKNKVVIPATANRRISAYSVANYIANPTASDLEVASIIDSNSLMLSNISNELRSDQISLNFAIDNTNSKIPRHTEWVLMREGDETSAPPALLERKMIDSLIGSNTATGALVPDPSLSARAKFGIGIRPQQTLFNDRFEALHNIVNFVNDILIDVPITGNYTLLNFNEIEPYPAGYTVVVDNYELDLITGTTSTAVVLADDTYDGGWTVYDYQNNQWTRVQTQSYNTTLYWKFVDWVAPTYNPYQDIALIFDEVDQIYGADTRPGQYIKINNRGDGNSIIVQALSTGTVGNFGTNYQIQYIQNGTIQLLDTLWNRSYGWDENYTYNQTLYDQTPNKEIEFILAGLKDEIFINDLSVNWNKLFFTAIKYAFSEQHTIDWAFKTSFINLTNYAEKLNQPPVYKLQDSSYYEDFINEIKPYRTKIRKYTTNFSNTEVSKTLVLDYDRPHPNGLIPYDWFNNPQNYSPIDGGSYIVSEVPTKNDIFSVPVRQMTETIVFDRVTPENQIGVLPVTDTFIGDGITVEFPLSWLAEPNRYKMSLSVTGEYVLPTDYTVKNYTQEYNGYNKQYSKLIFLNVDQVPAAGAIIIFSYEKSISLMTAVERIENFYQPTNQMISTATNQLMIGIDDPRVQMGGYYEGTTTIKTTATSVNGSIVARSAPVWSNTYGRSIPDTIINASQIDDSVYQYSGMEVLDVQYPSWNSGILVNALGINPTDLIIDGEYGFVTPNSAWAPEEVVPGLVSDTLGIDVYTKNPYSSPTVLTGSSNVFANDPSSAVIKLPVLPTTTGSIAVSFNGEELIYTPNSPDYGTYTINGYDLIIRLTVNGILTYTIVGVGDGVNDGVGIIDKKVSASHGSTTTQVVSLGSYNEVTSVYVTLNGGVLGSTPSITDPYYALTPASATDNRASVVVYNLTTTSNTNPYVVNSVQAWFFDNVAPNNKYNQVNIQTINVYNITYLDPNNSYTGTYINTNLPLGKIGPYSAQAIVQATDNNTGITKTLLPPSVTYYTVTSTNVTAYKINDISGTFVKDTNYGDNANVYINGTQLKLGQDYTFDDNNVTITKSFGVGDTIAVEAMMPHNFLSHYVYNNSEQYTYDYIINSAGDILFTPNYYNQTYITYTITTYNDQDNMGIETQVFRGNPYRTFKLNRPAMDLNYVWVTVNRSAVGALTLRLVGGIDFQLLPDHRTIVLSDAYIIGDDDTVVIMSIASPSATQGVLGYRIFKDILGKETYTRLSNPNSTYLTQPLYTTSTQIHVQDSSVLSPPNRAANIPGTILIDGELIEFYTNENNVLGQIRRGVRGTGVTGSTTASVAIGTLVIDQGSYQTLQIGPEIGYKETFLIQNTYTNAALVNTYSISTSTIKGWNWITSSTVRCDGITLIGSPWKSLTQNYPDDPFNGTYVNGAYVYSISTASHRAVDQVQVYYAGYPLRKDVSYSQDTTVSYDGILESQIRGSYPNVEALTNAYSVLKQDLQYTSSPAYVTTDTSIVWVYAPGRSQVVIDYSTSTGTASTLPKLSTGTTYLVTSTNKIYWSTGPTTNYVVTATLGFVDSGLRQHPADFSINTNTQVLTLNTATVTLTTGAILTIVMKEVNSVWNNIVTPEISTVSLTSSTGVLANFLRDGPAVLPDSYFYGKSQN